MEAVYPAFSVRPERMNDIWKVTLEIAGNVSAICDSSGGTWFTGAR